MILRRAAQVISVLCHPLLVVTYMLVILLLVNPYLFGVNHISDSVVLLLLVFFTTFFIPGIAVVMMKFLGLIESLEMKDLQDRTIPYIATGVFYLWMFINVKENPDLPLIFKSCVLGATLALFLAFFINLFSKISIHAVGMGGLTGMTVITMALYSYGYFMLHTPMWGYLQVSMSLLLMLVLLLSGIVGTCRLILNAHEIQDLYGGFLVGMVTQFFALQILM